MKSVAFVGLAAFALLAGCDRSSSPAEGNGPEGRGRYSGIGIYEAGRLWSQAKVDPATQAEGKAGLSDDEHIIVVVDSRSGEVRQCGDHSGICMAMHPWSGGSTATPLPVTLTKSAAQLDAEEKAPLENQSDRAN